jgi:toxin ParE1/3/4
VKHVFHPEAAAEFEQAVSYYEDRGAELGQRLATEVRSAIQRIVAAPEQWRILEGEVRRFLMRVFPYSVLYTIESEYILILALMHGKRQPGYWRDA